MGLEKYKKISSSMYFKFWVQTDNLLNKEYCWKLLLNSVKALSTLSVIGTIEPADAYFSGGFADSRSCKVLKKLTLHNSST